MARVFVLSLLLLGLHQEGGDVASEKSTLHEGLATAAEGAGEQLIKLKAWDEARAFLELIRAKSDARAEALEKLIAKTEKQSSGLKWEAKASDLIKGFGAERAKAFFAYSKSWKTKDAEAARWTEAEAEILDDLLDYVKAYARLTQIRAHYELPKTRFDWKLSVPAVWHAKYKLLNPKQSGEVEGSPGFTEEGKKSAQGSITSPDESITDLIEGLIHTPFHRNYILHPGLASLGLGQSRGTLNTSVIDVKGGLKPSGGFPAFLRIPRDNSTGVALSGYDDHIRIDQAVSMKSLGYPISLVFYDPAIRPRNVSISVTERLKNVDVYTSTPEKSTVPNGTPHQKNTILVVAKEPLRAETTYRVSVTYEATGKKEVIEWSFRTGR